MFSIYTYRIYETGQEFNVDLLEKQLLIDGGKNKFQ